MTTAPTGELRRQDFHLQVQQLVSLRSLLWVQVLRWDVTQAVESLGLDRRSREEFPRPVALQRAFRQALLVRSPQQGTVGIAEPAFDLVVRPGQPRHVVAVEQPGPIAPADLSEMMAKRTEGWGEIGPWSERIEIAAQWLGHLLALAGLRPRGLSDVGDVTEPGRPLLECLRGCSTGRQRRLESLRELGQARVRALGHQRQTQGRSACEREQGAGMAQECGDD